MFRMLHTSSIENWSFMLSPVTRSLKKKKEAVGIQYLLVIFWENSVATCLQVVFYFFLTFFLYFYITVVITLKICNLKHKDVFYHVDMMHPKSILQVQEVFW